MTQHGEKNLGGEWVFLRRRGVVRLVDSAIQAGNAAALTRRRGDTMIGLTATAGAWRVDAEVQSEEPDGTKWSLKITTQDRAQ